MMIFTLVMQGSILSKTIRSRRLFLKECSTVATKLLIVNTSIYLLGNLSKELDGSLAAGAKTYTYVGQQCASPMPAPYPVCGPCTGCACTTPADPVYCKQLVPAPTPCWPSQIENIWHCQ